MRVAIGCDEAAYDLKETLREHLLAQGFEAQDYGTFDRTAVLYPDVAFAVAEAVVAGKHDRAILLCGTGIGMAISANKVRGIRAAQAHDTYSAARASISDDAQIVSIGARVVGPELAKAIVDVFLASRFQGAKSADKIARIASYEHSAAAARS